MWYATSLAKEALPDWRPQLGGKFEPNLLNSVVFLVSTTQSVSVFAVNYKGKHVTGVLDIDSSMFTLHSSFDLFMFYENVNLLFCCLYIYCVADS
jgi:hypothetical protein